MRQSKEKWAINCSRSCARKAQHARNHAKKRTELECPVCRKKFIAVKWEKENGRTYCSTECAKTARFGEKDRSKMLYKVEAILKDDEYLRYINGLAKKISFKWRRDLEFAKEIVQEYFLRLCDGQNTMIEHVAKDMLRKELKRGITGKHNSDFNFNSLEALGEVKKKKNDLDSIEFKEYIIDLFGSLSEFERKFIWMYIKGFTNAEVMNEIRKKFPISNDNFYKEKRRIFKEIDYSNYGDNYKTRKDYK